MPHFIEEQCRVESVPLSLSSNGYEEKVQSVANRLKLLLHEGPAIYAQSGGIFPSDLIAEFETSSRSSPLTQLGENGLGPEYPGWPEEHPLDFDWRFERATAQRIATLAARFGRALCLGTPTVYHHLRKLDCETILVDRNPCLSEAFNHEHSLLFKDIDYLSAADMGPHFDVVIIDPPWYLDRFMRWIAIGARYVELGGTLLLTRFPPLVRSTAAQEWDQIYAFLQTLGPVCELQPDVIYRTPSFEQATFDLLGLGHIPYWRRATLVSVRILQRPDSDITVMKDRSARGLWRRFRIGTQVIAIKESEPIAEDGNFAFEPVSSSRNGNLVLSTVSGRYVGRPEIDFWTSRNAAGRLRGHSLAIAFFDFLEAGVAVPEAACLAAGDNLEVRESLLAFASSLRCMEA